MNVLVMLSQYADLMREMGVEKPYFLVNQDFMEVVKKAVFDKTYSWKPISLLPEELKNTPGAVGMYNGVLIIEVANYNVNIRDNYTQCHRCNGFFKYEDIQLPPPTLGAPGDSRLNEEENTCVSCYKLMKKNR